MTRHIVLVIDGTDCSATRGKRSEFTSAFAFAEASQDTTILYISGPGTRKTAGSIFDKALGSELEGIVREAYLHLCLNVNYSEKNLIYLFGYSRGAIAIKALLLFIKICGLLKRQHLESLNHAYYSYLNDTPINIAGLQDKSIWPQIEFVGLYDPVLGPDNVSINIKFDTHVSAEVNWAVEILSLNEARPDFAHHAWSPVEDLSATSIVASVLNPSPKNNLLQIWVPGCHGDIAHPESNSVITDIVLLTMLQQVKSSTKLALSQTYLDLIYSRIIGKTKGVYIRDRSSAFNRRQRSVTPNVYSQVHPICLTLNKRFVIWNGKRRYYKSLITQDAVDEGGWTPYSFDLRGVVTSSEAHPEKLIFESLKELLDQNSGR